MSFTVFADESGNTGPNLNEGTQPVFVHAALLVPTKQLDTARDLAKELKTNFLPQSKELHAGIINTTGGRKRVATLLRELTQMEILPLISIMERRYVRSSYLVETCFDYWWNEKANPQLMSSANDRQELAHTLVDLVPDRQLLQFASAFRKRDPNGIRNAINEIAATLTANARSDLADTMIASSIQMDDQCRTIQSVDQQATAVNTINTSSFSTLITMAERAALGLNLASGKAVHDECPQFPAYKWTFQLLRNRANGAIVFDNGQIGVALRRIESLELGDSTTEPILQLADVVAGTYRHLTTEKNGLKDPAFDDWLLYAYFCRNETCNTVISRRLDQAVWAGPLHRASVNLSTQHHLRREGS